jgi:hypothetical protein
MVHGIDIQYMYRSTSQDEIHVFISNSSSPENFISKPRCDALLNGAEIIHKILQEMLYLS